MKGAINYMCSAVIESGECDCEYECCRYDPEDGRFIVCPDLLIVLPVIYADDEE